jgi:hypothetical protein
MPMDVLQSYGNNSACPSCVQLDPERLDLHIGPSHPRMHSMLRDLSRRIKHSRFWRHTARGSFQLPEIEITTNLGLHCKDTILTRT